MLGRPDIAALRSRPDDAARLLAAIVRNAARNLRRRHHRARPHVELDAEPLPAAEPRPDDALEHAATAVQLVGCLAQLGDVHRQIVTLRVLEELSGEEAARALGLTPSHVAVLLHRARKQLERCMQAALGPTASGGLRRPLTWDRGAGSCLPCRERCRPAAT